MSLFIASIILLAIGQLLVWWPGEKSGGAVWRAGMFVTIVATALVFFEILLANI